MLDYVETQGLTHIISWELNGTAIKIHNAKKFVGSIDGSDGIMTKFFTHTRLKSFQRKLNIEGFYRIPSGVNKGCYIHKIFHKKNRSLPSMASTTKATMTPSESTPPSPPLPSIVSSSRSSSVGTTTTSSIQQHQTQQSYKVDEKMLDGFKGPFALLGEQFIICHGSYRSKEMLTREE